MRMCSRCVMDESDAEIKFSESGCNHCDTAARKLNLMTSFSDSNLQNLMAQILSMQRNGHLFLIGLSGGLDSSYLLLRLVEFGIKPVVFHVDAGWNRPQAVKNVYNLANNFNLELRTRVTTSIFKKWGNESGCSTRSCFCLCAIFRNSKVKVSKYTKWLEHSIRINIAQQLV